MRVWDAPCVSDVFVPFTHLTGNAMIVGLKEDTVECQEGERGDILIERRNKEDKDDT